MAYASACVLQMVMCRVCISTSPKATTPMYRYKTSQKEVECPAGGANYDICQDHKAAKAGYE